MKRKIKIRIKFNKTGLVDRKERKKHHTENESINTYAVLVLVYKEVNIFHCTKLLSMFGDMCMSCMTIQTRDGIRCDTFHTHTLANVHRPHTHIRPFAATQIDRHTNTQTVAHTQISACISLQIRICVHVDRRRWQAKVNLLLLLHPAKAIPIRIRVNK